MKKHFYLITLLLIAYNSFSQMEEKFYHPNKKWGKMDSLNYVEKNYFIDNDTLNTIFLAPNTEKAKATIVYFHGGGGNVSRFAKIVKPLLQDGFQVYMIDFRGYGKSSGKPTHLNIASDGQIILNDILKQDLVKNTPVILYGASMGTQIATKLAADNEDKIKGLILDGTIMSFTDIALLSVPVEQKEMVRSMIVSPYSAIESIQKIQRIPVLFIHSAEDKEVPLEQGEAVFKAAKTKKEMWLYKGPHILAPKLFPAIFVEKVNNLLNGLK